MKRFLLALVLLNLLPATCWAQRVDQLPNQFANAPDSMNDRIAAVVNDNVISTSDIRERTKLAILSAGLPATSEIAQRLLPQILRGLIDEQLQLQEAKRLEITVSKEELDRMLDHIAKENKIMGDMRDYVKTRGASPTVLEQQIRAGLSWTKVVQRELRPRVDVGDDEVEAAIERMHSNAGKEEFQVGEIFLTVDNPKDDDQVRQAASNLVDEIKSGANFGAVARQFSQSTGAASGGDIGWIQQGQLAPELNKALTSMQVGEVSDPIRSASGYHILSLREKRTLDAGASDPKDISLDLQQVFRPFAPGVTHEILSREAALLRTSVHECSQLPEQLQEKFPSWRAQGLGKVKLGDVPAWLITSVRDTPVGQGSGPLWTDKGALIVFVCGRHVPESSVDREAILNSIGTEKLELQARRLMRDLRRAAYVDIRLGSSS